MRLAGKIFWVTMSSVAVSSCFDPPEFPIVPVIAFEELRFAETPGAGSDTLVLRISFKDGDGDLGLGTDETIVGSGSNTSYYNDRWYYTLEPFADCDDDPTDGINRCYGIDFQRLDKYVNYELKRNPVNGSD